MVPLFLGNPQLKNHQPMRCQVGALSSGTTTRARSPGFCFSALHQGLGFRALGLRVKGFGALGFRALGLRV